MKKLLLFSLFALIASFVGRAELKTYTEDFSSGNIWKLATSNQNKAGTGDFTSTTTKLTYSISWNNACYYFGSKALFIGKTGSYVQLPSFDGVVKKIVLTTPDSGSLGAVNVKITDDKNNEVCASQTTNKVKTDYTYNIPEAKQGEKNIYRIYVANNKNAQYTKITIYVEETGGTTPDPEPGTVAPTFSPADGSKVEYGSTVTVTSAEGTTLVVTYDGADHDSESNTYTFTLPAEDSGLKTYSVEAKAVGADKKESEVAEATYTFINNKVANIKEFLTAADAAEAKTIQAPATVIYQNGINLYLKDETGYLYVYGSTGLSDLKNGDVIEAGYEVKYDEFNSLPQAIPTADTFKKSETAGTVVAPEEATIELLGACNLNVYVSLKKVKCISVSGQDATFADFDNENQTIAIRDKYKLNSVEAGKVYNLEGFYSIYKTTNQVVLTKAEELKYVATPTITPEFGEIEVGTEITIDCATEGAEFTLFINGDPVENVTVPYTFTANEVGTLKVEVVASKDGYQQSEELNGVFNVVKPSVAALTVDPAAGTKDSPKQIEVGTAVTISSATEGAKLYGEVNGVDLGEEGVALPYTIEAKAEGELSFTVWASKDNYDDCETVEGYYTVVAKQAVEEKTATWTFVGVSGKTAKLSDDSAKGTWTSTASYLGTQTNSTEDKGKSTQFGSKSNSAADSELTLSNSDIPSSATIKTISVVCGAWDDNNEVSIILNFGSQTNLSSKVMTSGVTGTDNTAAAEVVFDNLSLQGNALSFSFSSTAQKCRFIIKSISVTYVNDEYPGGADVTYNKTTSSDVVGKFAVLAANLNSSVVAVSREDASKGVEVDNDGDEIALVKAQTAVDEFEVVANGDSYYLYGGLENSVSKNRHYLTYSGSELAYVESEDANAAVTFEQRGAGLVVKFNDGQYLVYNGTAFVKGYLVATPAEGDAVTPVYVYMSASNVSTGVDSIDADEAGVAEYYNLNGVKVNVENLTPGLYIVRQGSKVSKQVIR